MERIGIKSLPMFSFLSAATLRRLRTFANSHTEGSMTKALTLALEDYFNVCLPLNADTGGVADNYTRRLLYQADPFFKKTYGDAMEKSTTPSDSLLRRERFYNTVQFLKQTTALNGEIAECGVWKGLSSYIFCHYLTEKDPAFKGRGYRVFDSFEGLSAPEAADDLSEETHANLRRQFGKVEGAYSASLEDVRRTLSDFPAIIYHPGWIPESLRMAPEALYRFVHVDLDLYRPTLGAIEYFFPRLAPHGIIICDDYGSLAWPGARKAIDDFRKDSQVGFITISTGQAILWKK